MFIRGYEWREIFLYLCRVSVCIKFWVMLIQSMSFVLYLEWIFSRLLKRFIQVWMNHLLINPKALVTVHSTDWMWVSDHWERRKRNELWRYGNMFGSEKICWFNISYLKFHASMIDIFVLIYFHLNEAFNYLDFKYWVNDLFVPMHVSSNPVFII